ncbi:MAG: UPF0125 protein [Porticoccaceae bacterium]|nr:MAG: UPF0125 protein [Porticoccaceae bacterium]
MAEQESDNSGRAHTIRVEVAYALPHKQMIIPLEVPEGTTALEAVLRSRIADHFEGLDPTRQPLGIFGQVLGSKGLPPPERYVLADGDRVEIYRPLIADPREVRRSRAVRAQKKADRSEGG